MHARVSELFIGLFIFISHFMKSLTPLTRSSTIILLCIHLHQISDGYLWIAQGNRNREKKHTLINHSIGLQWHVLTSVNKNKHPFINNIKSKTKIILSSNRNGTKSYITWTWWMKLLYINVANLTIRNKRQALWIENNQLEYSILGH